MNIFKDSNCMGLAGGVFVLLSVATLTGQFLKWKYRNSDGAIHGTIQNLNVRIYAWWGMNFVFLVTLAMGGGATTLLFALVSLLALREFITLTPTRRGDHRSLFWVFFVFTPLQYLFLVLHWKGLFTILLPVYAFLFIPIRSAMSGDCSGFLERTAKIQWALMVCVYCLSHAPALLTLKFAGYQSVGLLYYFIVMVQLSDVLQYVFGKCFGRHPIAPHVSPNKTWEGFIGGVLTTTLIGGCLWKLTPFQAWEAMLICLAITLMGFGGGLAMSAIKRDRGVKDYGAVIPGHGGVLDRIDSICFSAPVFYHLVEYYFT